MIYDDEFEESGEGFEDEDDAGIFKGNDIVYYIVDEDDNEIGYGYRLEGEVYEYYYENYDDSSDDQGNGRWGCDEELDSNGMYTYYEETEFW